jgi:ribosomal protein L21E
MKFKMGDKVKIIDEPSIKECGYCVCDMNKTIGKTGKIVSKSRVFSKCYEVEIDNVS